MIIDIPFYDLKIVEAPLYDSGEFMRKRVQGINTEAVLRIRELRIVARTMWPCINGEMLVRYLDAMDNAKQIDILVNFLLDMFGVEPVFQ